MSQTLTVHRVALVACTKGKRAERSPAQDLYTGDLFAKARTYAETFDSWGVLSAKHGLVSPGEIIEPYNVVLGNTKTGPPIHAWTDGVIARLLKLHEKRLSDGEKLHLTLLAGQHYRGVLAFLSRRADWCAGVDEPMKHLGIGQQKAWLLAQVPPRSIGADRYEQGRLLL